MPVVAADPGGNRRLSVAEYETRDQNRAGKQKSKRSYDDEEAP
jgi:hypothetical protein